NVTQTDVSDTNGVASMEVSSRTDRIRGNAEVLVEALDQNGVPVVAKTVTVNLDREPLLQAITFVGASPQTIGVRGGAYPSSSLVTFRVFDDLGRPLPGVAMTFDLNATADPEAVVVAQGTTDAGGTVSTTVSAGTQAAPISVVATAHFNG